MYANPVELEQVKNCQGWISVEQDVGGRDTVQTEPSSVRGGQGLVSVEQDAGEKGGPD